MEQVLLVVQILLALALIGVVLLQRSEGGGLGIGGGGGGGGGGMSGFLTGRGTANLLTRTTAILAACFMVSSLLLTILAGSNEPRSIIETLPQRRESARAFGGDSAAPNPVNDEAAPTQTPEPDSFARISAGFSCRRPGSSPGHPGRLA